MNLNKRIETIRLKIRKKYIKITAKKRKKRIKNHNFTIISNNCWGGFIYQSYALKYNSPTIGLFIMAEDYIDFIKNFKENINKDIKEINYLDSKWYKTLKNNESFGKYPIGKIGDIEIHFLHYKSFEEAIEKWNRRKERINYNNVLFKFSEMNSCEEKDIINFQSLKLKNKICFVTNKYKHLVNDYTYVVTNKKELTSSYEPFGKSFKVNINEYIDNISDSK